MWVPVCSPSVSVYHAQVGPPSSYLLIASRLRLGVLANGGGSLITGVDSLNGCVRSTMSTLPAAIALISLVTDICSRLLFSQPARKASSSHSAQIVGLTLASRTSGWPRRSSDHSL